MKDLRYSLKSLYTKTKLLFVGLLLLGKCYGQVNLQTGSATFSLPMFNWQDDKSRLNSIVALSYSSGNGLKVNDIASNVGQGWSLVAGGVITRMQVGEADDQIANGIAASSDLTKFPPGYLYASEPASKGCPNALTRYPLYKSKDRLYAQHNKVAEDRQLDYFTFQFNGKAGLFILDPASINGYNADGDIGIPLGDSKMKIRFQHANLLSAGIRTTITSFTIQDVDGLIYTFSVKGLEKVVKTAYCDGGLVEQQYQPKFKNKRCYHEAGFEDASIPYSWKVSSWYLSEIKDPLTNRKVCFAYARTNEARNYADNNISLNDNNNENKDYVIISHRLSVTQTPELSSITYPDGHAVQFNYGDQRVDLKGDYRLSSVDIKYQQRFLSEYKLNTTYFIKTRYGTPVSDYEKKYARLCLKSVQKIGVDLKEDTPPYIFDYYFNSTTNADDYIPPRFHYIKDVWGFYNGTNCVSWDNSHSIPLDGNPDRFSHDELSGLCFLNQSTPDAVYMSPKSGYAKNGLLRQIIYPTGGTLSYEYEQNWGTPVGNTYRMVGGVHVSKTSSTDGGFSNNCTNALSTTYSFVLDQTGSPSSLWGLDMPINSVKMSSFYSPEVKRYHWTLSCAGFGCCYYKFMYPGIQSRQQSTNLADWQKTMQAVAPVLGILSVVTTIMDVATYAIFSNPYGMIVDIITGVINAAVTCFVSMDRISSVTVYYNNDLRSSSPLPSQFKRVEIIEDPGGIGKTVQEFTSDLDYHVWFPENEYLSMKQRFASWAYGLPLRTTVFDANNNKIKQVENTYDFTYAQRDVEYCSVGHGPCDVNTQLYTRLVSCNCVPKYNSSQNSDDWEDFSKFSVGYRTIRNYTMDVDFYGFYTGRTELATTKEKVFKIGDQNKYVETVTNYLYDLNNYQVTQVSTTESNGNENLKEFTYSDSYGGIFSTMTNNNILGIPIKTVTKILKPAGGPDQGEVHEARTDFIQIASGDIKPSAIYEKRFAKPGFASSPEKLIQSFTYDDDGNLIGVKDEGAHTVTNFYGYNDKYVIASVINADPLIDKSAYADFEITSGWNGWTLNGTGAYSNTAMTGSRAFILSSQSSFVSTQLNTAKAYLVSFWSTTSSVVASAGTLVKSAPTLNGFTYYEYELPQGTSSVSISGNGTIDELRLYPKTARMRSISYDPLIGKTSECDENNRITYYEYDNLGRLQLIKDEKKNVVKMYEYNNISAAKQNGCPGTYYNKFISETFTKQGCGEGYVGAEVPYSIPANKYSSSLSQEDADKQAENELIALGQQNANNTPGQCLLIYYSDSISVMDSTESCGDGEKGGFVMYKVPAGKYTSTISQADANEKALNELEANSQTWANDPAHAVCIFDGDPRWEAPEDAPVSCQPVDGTMHKFIFATDVNPNSLTYNTSQWTDAGPSADCPPSSCSNCSGPAYKCIDGICELGLKTYIGCLNANTRIYRYEFTDGSWSTIYYEPVTSCP